MFFVCLAIFWFIESDLFQPSWFAHQLNVINDLAHPLGLLESQCSKLFDMKMFCLKAYFSSWTKWYPTEIFWTFWRWVQHSTKNRRQSDPMVFADSLSSWIFRSWNSNLFEHMTDNGLFLVFRSNLRETYDILRQTKFRWNFGFEVFWRNYNEYILSRTYILEIFFHCAGNCLVVPVCLLNRNILKKKWHCSFLVQNLCRALSFLEVKLVSSRFLHNILTTAFNKFPLAIHRLDKKMQRRFRSER